MMSEQEFLNSGLIEQYVLKLLVKKSDIEMVEEYIEKYPEVKAYYHSVKSDMLNLAKENAIHPPESPDRNLVKSLIKERLQNQKNVAPNQMMKLFLFLSLLSLGWITYLHFQSNKKYQRLNTSYQSLIKECEIKESTLALMNDFYHDQHTALKVMQSESFKSSFYINKDKGQFKLSYFGKEALPEHECYVLWGEIDDQMQKLGKLDDLLQDGKLIPLHKDTKSLNVTIEDINGDFDQPNPDRLIGCLSL